MAEYIEREAIIKQLEELISDRWNDKTAPVSWSHAYADTIDILEMIPAADVEPVVRGQWIMQADETHFCSECGKDALFRRVYDLGENIITFIEQTGDVCPHCGVKMD